MQNKSRGIRMPDDIYNFIQEIAPDYSKNMSEFISDVFYFALNGTNPESGNNIKQFYDDARNGKWANKNTVAYKLQQAADIEYSAFCRFMDDLYDSEIQAEVKLFLLSEQTAKAYWESRMPKLTAYLKYLSDDYDVSLLPGDFIRYFSLWMAEKEKTGQLLELRKGLVGDLFRKHHPLDVYIEGDDE